MSPTINELTKRRRVPRFSRDPNYPPITINHSKHQLLQAVGRYTYLTAPQLTRLLYSQGSLTFVQEQLSQLYQAKYLERLYPYPTTPKGAPLAAYCLDNLGYQYLKEAGVAPEGRFRASDQGKRHPFFLRHSLAANDLLILGQR